MEITSFQNSFFQVAAVVLIMMFGVGCGIASDPPTPTSTPLPTPTPTPDWDIEGWELVWHDEFDGPEIDSSKWTHEVHGQGGGNGEVQYYTDHPQNSFIENGVLIIQALEENYRGKRYTSARLNTRDKFNQLYGRIEARLQLPFGQGLWPAFWMLGSNLGEVTWPHSGEIDIMENVGHEPSTVHGTVHGPGYSGGNGVRNTYRLPANQRFADDYHIFAIEWEPGEIRWYVDGNLFSTVTADDVPGEWVYDHPFFLIMNVAVGGRWPGYPDETTTFPQTMKVDYVRVYQLQDD